MQSPRPRWDALDAARRTHAPRRPLLIDGRRVGSVAEADVHALRRWPTWIDVRADGIHVITRGHGQDEIFALVNAALRADGLIRAWRDEAIAVLGAFDAPGSVHEPMGSIERASARFWGTRTLGAHANGYVTDDRGHPVAMWVARRSSSKPTDPGKRDNLVGGGVPAGQSPRQALEREAWEEAGIEPHELQQGLRPGSIVRIDADIAEGRQVEDLHVYDLLLPHGRVPENQDGEVAAIELVDVATAIEWAAIGEMTVDAALATLDFALRHHVVPADEQAALAARFNAIAHGDQVG